jgi:hypothetical protein
LGSYRQEVVALSRSLVGHRSVAVDGRAYGRDCAGLLEAVFDQVGIDLLADAQRGDNGVRAMYRYAKAHGRVFTEGRPLPGDLVFFHDGDKLTRDGPREDQLNHVGIVESVDEDGTVSVIHHVRQGVARYRMNVARRSERLDARTGRPLNDALRSPHGEALTGELFSAYAVVLPLQGPDVGDDHLPFLRPQPADGSI